MKFTNKPPSPGCVFRIEIGRHGAAGPVEIFVNEDVGDFPECGCIADAMISMFKENAVLELANAIAYLNYNSDYKPKDASEDEFIERACDFSDLYDNYGMRRSTTPAEPTP